VSICAASSISSYQPVAPGKLDAFLGNPSLEYSRLTGNYYNSWKKYNLPMPRRECVYPERRIGSGHGTYDHILLLNEVPDYEA
jgi:hypothetical protein